MKRFITFLMLLIATPVFGATFGIEGGAQSTTVTVHNTNIGTSYEIMSQDESFAQLAATDSLHFVLSNAADSVIVRVRGIDENDTRKVETITVKTDSAVTATKWKYYEGSDIVGGNALAGSLFINRATGGTHVSKIESGKANDDVAQWFNDGDDQGYVAHWEAGVTSTTGTVIFEIRFYYNQASARSGGNGYEIVDTIALPAALGKASGSFPLPQAGTTSGANLGWYSVWAIGGTGGADGYVKITFIKK